MFFDRALQKDQMLPPLRIDDGSYLVVRIDGWEDERLITDLDIRNRMRQVKDKLHAIKANEIYTQQVVEIMRGKQLAFMPETFRKLVEIIGPRYLKSMQDKEQAFDRQFWGRAHEVELDSIPGDAIEQLRQESLFQLDGEIWTVADFEELVKSHPLVFRKRQIAKHEFTEQLKLAVVDLIRDHFITQEA